MRFLTFMGLVLGGLLLAILVAGGAFRPPSQPALSLTVSLDAVKIPPAPTVFPGQIHRPAAAETPLTPTPKAPPAAPEDSQSIPTQARTTRPIDLRDGAGGVHDRIGRLSVGEIVTPLGRDGDWYLVSLPSGVTGWLPDRALQFPVETDPSQLPAVFSRPPLPEILLMTPAITIRSADIYAGPSFDQPVLVANVPPGSAVTPSGRDELGMWLSIEDGFGEIGWLLASSLQFAPDFAIMDLPQRTETRAPTGYDWSRHVFEWGGQTHDMRHAGEMAALGMQWIKVQAKWHADSRPEDVVALIRQAHDRGFRLLLSIPGQPYPTAIDFDAYVSFLEGIATLDPPPDALEIWNEMNIDFEWPAGEIDPALYVEHMLKPAYEAIKSANPDILVISGAPAPTGFDNGTNAWADDRYLAGMVQAGAADFLDCIGVHYNAGATSPRASSGHPAGAFYGWYFKPVLSMYFHAFGDAKPLCLTEIGYLTDDDLTGLKVPERFWWAAGTTVDNHARWLADAREVAAGSGFVRLMIIFSMDIYHWDRQDPQTGYAIFRPRGNCPACEVLGSDGAP